MSNKETKGTQGSWIVSIGCLSEDDKKKIDSYKGKYESTRSGVAVGLIKAALNGTKTPFN